MLPISDYNNKMATKFLTLLLLVSRTCTVTQGSTDYEDDNENTIIEDIPNLLTSNSTLEIMENETLELYCQFNSEISPHLDVMWRFKNSDSTQNAKIYSIGVAKIYNKRNFTVETLAGEKNHGMKLIIPNVSVDDTGDYKCALNNPRAEIAVQNVKVLNSSAIKTTFIPFLLICSVTVSMFRS